MAATWSGWVIQFLNRANVLNTPPNQAFMEAWAAHAPGSCRNNPIDLTHAVAGSSRCGDTVGGFGRSQNYGTHAEAAQAFALSLHTAWAKPLLQALNSGNPFQIGDRSAVVAVLERWASPSFAAWYKNANNDGTGGSSSSSSTAAPHTHKGWTDLRRSVNHSLPEAIKHSQRLTNQALRSLGRGHKVR